MKSNHYTIKGTVENSKCEYTAVATVHDISDMIQRLTKFLVSQMDDNDIATFKKIFLIV